MTLGLGCAALPTPVHAATEAQSPRRITTRSRYPRVVADNAGTFGGPLRRFGAPDELQTELASQVTLLEAMFDDPGLVALRRRYPSHPAVRWYASLVAGLQAPPDEDIERTRVQDIARGLIDRTTWALEPSVRPFWPSTVPDAEQARQVLRRIHKPKQYADTTLELFVWGALRLAGMQAELQESVGEPDIRLPGPSSLDWLEVKRLGLGAGPDRARDALARANHQIKTVSPNRAGTVYLFVPTVGETAAFDDTIPRDVEPYVAEVRRTLGSPNDTHVGQVIVGWDDFMVLGHLPDPVMYAVRRRAIVLDHATPISQLPPTDWAGACGFTCVLWIRPAIEPGVRPEPVVAGNVVMGDLFTDRNNWVGGIMASNARRVLESPEGRVELPLVGGEMSVVLATKRIDLTVPPHVILLIGYRTAQGPLTLADGFRLRGDDSDLDAWKTNPPKAFDELLRRYGLPVSIGSGPSQLFHLHYEAAAAQDIAIAGTDDTAFVVATIVKSSPGLWEADWTYAIDDSAYRAAYTA